jgi:hypothetical protein
MFYAAGRAIGEARSDDGRTWTRVDGDPSTEAMDPVLAPSGAAGATGPTGATGAFDAAQVDDPCVALRTTPAGRLQVRVLYTGYASSPGAGADSAIGFAARYGEAGALARQAQGVYSASPHAAAPALFEAGGTSLLYVQADEGSVDPARPYPAIAAAVAPVRLSLPAAAAFPATP